MAIYQCFIPQYEITIDLLNLSEYRAMTIYQCSQSPYKITIMRHFKRFRALCNDTYIDDASNLSVITIKMLFNVSEHRVYISMFQTSVRNHNRGIFNVSEYRA
jgi:hypothetical protein